MKKFFLLTALFLAGACSGALVYGSVYDANLELLDKAIVSINSTPRQLTVAANGSYSFQVKPGMYLLKAEYRAGGRAHSASEEIVIEEATGEYEIDLIILSYAAPLEEKELEELMQSFPKESEALITQPTQPSKPQEIEGAALLVVFLALVALLALVFLFLGGKRRQRTGKVVAKMIRKLEKTRKTGGAGRAGEVILTREQKELLKKIVESGGRVTQRELRKQVPYSEAKVSLDLDVLEAQGFVKKFKKGRGNIIVLQEK